MGNTWLGPGMGILQPWVLFLMLPLSVCDCWASVCLICTMGITVYHIISKWPLVCAWYVVAMMTDQ